MRELRVIGVTPDSTHIVCIDAETGNKYRLPADDKLRAAARGDLARFGQIEIEMEATMRPRDIQARIRAGASVEQVTEESGMPASRVDRFAYPVLLERARAAELAQKAHPVRGDGPAVETLIDIVTAAFTERGHNIEGAEWDAWKDEKGFWVAQLQWQNGRSDITAHWRYQPDAHGGSVAPLDAPASDLIDPDFGRALRGLATILPAPQAEIEAPAALEPPVETRPAETRPAETRPAREAVAPAARTASRQPTLDEYYEQRSVVAGGGAAAIPAAASSAAIPAASTNTVPAAGGNATSASAGSNATPAAAGAAATDAGAAPAGPKTPSAPQTPAAEETGKPGNNGKTVPAKPNRTKRGKAPMPSWEDVLLGVRSSGH
ncbi:septation protein SepH [Nocardia australiensis]|uniref:septation protein SepH n=1 Tax=Nocardia australiensis TaxID=2887191 RepID=UPI001D152201|nr:septation protein SepH [Nocardia australiensis]